MVRAALWESERNAIETVLSDAQVRSVSPAVREFLPQIHAFLGSKMAGEAPPCPKSILGLGPFLRYYLIRCSDEDFDSAVQAVSSVKIPLFSRTSEVIVATVLHALAMSLHRERMYVPPPQVMRNS